MKIKYLFVLLLLLNSCAKESEIILPQFEEKLVVVSKIIKGNDFFIVKLDKTINPTSGYFSEPTDTSFANATVSLFYNGNKYNLQIIDTSEHEKYNLPPYGYWYNQVWYRDPNRRGKYFVLNKKVENINNIKLTVDYQTYNAEAECNMPPAIKINKIRFIGSLNSSNYYSNFKIGINADFPIGISYYLMKIRVKGFSYNAWYDSDVFEKPIMINKTSQENEFIFDINKSIGKSSDSLIYKFILFRVEKEYHDFVLLASDIGQSGDFEDIIPSETIEIPNNIRGGYGFFTAMSSDTANIIIP